MSDRFAKKKTLHIFFFGSNVSTVKVTLRVTIHIYQKLAGPLKLCVKECGYQNRA